MTAIAIALVMISACIVNAYPLWALGLGFTGYAIGLWRRWLWKRRHGHVLTQRNIRCILRYRRRT